MFKQNQVSIVTIIKAFPVKYFFNFMLIKANWQKHGLFINKMACHNQLSNKLKILVTNLHEAQMPPLVLQRKGLVTLNRFLFHSGM